MLKTIVVKLCVYNYVCVCVSVCVCVCVCVWGGREQGVCGVRSIFINDCKWQSSVKVCACQVVCVCAYVCVCVC